MPIVLSFVAASLMTPMTGVLQGSDTHSLRWYPKAGDKLSYEMSVKSSGGPTTFEAVGVVEFEVTAGAGQAGYSIKSTSKGMLVKMMGEEVRDDRQNPVLAKHGPDGRIVSLKTDTGDIETYRMGAITKFVGPPMPVKVGDSWRYVRERERPAGVPAWETSYKFEKIVEAGGKRYAEVSFIQRETSGDKPRSGQGSWRIELSTGIPESLEAKVTIPKPNQVETLTVSLKRL